MRMAGDRWCTHCACKDGLSISVYQKNIDYASGAGADCGAILGMMFGCFWTEYSVMVLICKGVICSGCFAACCVGARGVYRCKGKFWLSITASILLLRLELGPLRNLESLGYKIVVDGEWRHDEHQPFENGNYWTVNTVFLARESDYVPGILNPQMHSGSNMDVDNEAFQRLAGLDENLKDVAFKILQNNVATVSVIHSSSGNASIPQLLHLASLSGILKCKVFAGTLNILLGHYRCSNYQSVQFL
ncbi:Sucrose nonfermenting 4-like protein [Camellia lanceoleosa]|uniref:Sucrose nonfermenting 4-like protein n=1 Tax=Camellia lanceoleosa TaxID=1840588 RepID=A0ACC0HGR9_9ERIC|nr:Sucrose nonfermenting 4-like protein [Camellia lanceoleosa]